MRGKGPGMEQITKRAANMEVSEAMKHLEGKLPAEMPHEVVAFMQTNKKVNLDDTSIETANNIIRRFIVVGWQELDKEIIKCKEFEDRNRGTYDQVMTDLRRLASRSLTLNANGLKQTRTSTLRRWSLCRCRPSCANRR